MAALDFNAFNRQITAEFHANAGNVGGAFGGKDVLILTSTGAKSGQTRWNPLVYTQDGGRYVIVASKGGAPTSPDWYYNLLAYPSVSIEVGTENVSVEASVVTGDERDRLYAKHAERMPQFLDYAKNTTRRIPVVVLTPKG